MTYKKLFQITLSILGLVLFAFVIVPIGCGYSIGFLDGYQLTIEAVYYISSVAVAIAVALFTYKIYKKQLTLMERQAEIASEQTAISNMQTKIMEQQNKIVLFEKRYELYQDMLNILTLSSLFQVIVEGFEKSEHNFKENHISTVVEFLKSYPELDVEKTFFQSDDKLFASYKSAIFMLVKRQRQNDGKIKTLFSSIVAKEYRVVIKCLFNLISISDVSNEELILRLKTYTNQCDIFRAKCVKEIADLLKL